MSIQVKVASWPVQLRAPGPRALQESPHLPSGRAWLPTPCSSHPPGHPKVNIPAYLLLARTHQQSPLLSDKAPHGPQGSPWADLTPSRVAAPLPLSSRHWWSPSPNSAHPAALLPLRQLSLLSGATPSVPPPGPRHSSLLYLASSGLS